ncbi:TIGR00266 family protein [Nocardioides sp. GXQ0305]|uniref:TIGR00266 family protein n=1 Tax=Nocardioides sp. GXQ0305 TaxID=3423912 RepID=UPI003D7C7BEE
MHVDIRHTPSFALAVLTLSPGEEVKAEAGAMTSMSGGVEIETKAQGGIMKGLRRSVLGGESFFVNTFRAPGGGELTLSPTLPGDIIDLPLSGQTLLVQSGSWLASSPDIEVDTKWGGGKTFFSGEGLFLLRCSGAGDMLVSSFGAIEQRTLGAGEVLKVDTGHVVAFEQGVGYEVSKVGRWKSTLLSGEGLVATFTGPGSVWMQTRSPSDFLGWLIPQLPSRSE